MKLTSIEIKNFRCFENIALRVRGNAVIIGENNAGKSALLDAVKIALGRRWGRSGNTGFNEYDFRPALPEEGAGQRPIEITLGFAESRPGEWHEDITASLLDITRTNPYSGINSIEMRVRCQFAEVTKSVEPEWQFLNEDGSPYSGKGARNQNLSNFFDFVPCFSMAAMRDASVEFGGKSRFWGTLLKSVDINPEKTAELEGRFAELNSELLLADPKIEAIKSTLRAIADVIAVGAAGNVDVRAVPINLWDIISRAELLVQGKGADPWLPIHRHGNGVQSLAVMFLFRAYIENMLSESFTDQSEPILTLEEPEAHLHPQACRALWSSIIDLPGQKIITTHSPYFVQNVPLKDLIILRRGPSGPKGYRIEQVFSARVPKTAELTAAIAKHSSQLKYIDSDNTLECEGFLDQTVYRDLLRCFTGEGAPAIHAALRALRDATEAYISNEDIGRLESWAKRIRGEIFFARKWILCEGQAEYALMGAISERLNRPLDAHGIAVIDYQNNGSPGAFASLARALGFDWVMLCDGDGGGSAHIDQLKSRQFSNAELGRRVVQLPGGLDLEPFLAASSLRPQLLAAARELDQSVSDEDAELLAFADKHKEELAVRLAAQIRAVIGPIRVPTEFINLFELLGETE